MEVIILFYPNVHLDILVILQLLSLSQNVAFSYSVLIARRTETKIKAKSLNICIVHFPQNYIPSTI